MTYSSGRFQGCHAEFPPERYIRAGSSASKIPNEILKQVQDDRVPLVQSLPRINFGDDRILSARDDGGSKNA